MLRAGGTLRGRTPRSPPNSAPLPRHAAPHPARAATGSPPSLRMRHARRALPGTTLPPPSLLRGVCYFRAGWEDPIRISRRQRRGIAGYHLAPSGILRPPGLDQPHRGSVSCPAAAPAPPRLPAAPRHGQVRASPARPHRSAHRAPAALGLRGTAGGMLGGQGDTAGTASLRGHGDTMQLAQSRCGIPAPPPGTATDGAARWHRVPGAVTFARALPGGDSGFGEQIGDGGGDTWQWVAVGAE
ncbi:putative uncharacterized protein encoded by LINC00482 [Melospiza melodia melodia]|uniref:putative uncharacterized protein encoded by LINC00482 n=1 Tax=Melospiza melodia melodia TaxID=1914991 RepID=UPI002FD672A7